MPSDPDRGTGLGREGPWRSSRRVFVQVMDFLPWKTFHRIVDRYGGDHRTRSLSCAEQFRVMAFAQLTYRERLRDIEVCLAAQAGKLWHRGPAPKHSRHPNRFNYWLVALSSRYDFPPLRPITSSARASTRPHFGNFDDRRAGGRQSLRRAKADSALGSPAE
jgi:hypothetical protein